MGAQVGARAAQPLAHLSMRGRRGDVSKVGLLLCYDLRSAICSVPKYPYGHYVETLYGRSCQATSWGGIRRQRTFDEAAAFHPSHIHTHMAAQSSKPINICTWGWTKGGSTR